MKAWGFERDQYGCELWLGRKTRDGYASTSGSLRAVHLLRWEAERGPIPKGKQLDHLCRRRHCIALHHLELVSASENASRRFYRYLIKWRCPKGHEWPINKVIIAETKGRVCRQCNRDALSES
jgi:hypothetical protein